MSEVTQALTLARAPVGRGAVFVRSYGVTALVAAVVFLVAYDNGGFGESTRDALGIALWWVVILGIGLGVWPLVRVPAAAVATGGLLAAFSLFTLLSVIWAADTGGAYAEFTRVALYVAVFAVAVVASRRENAGRWCDGLALGIVAVAVIALVSRFFPGTFSNGDINRLLPEGANRLAFPVGYWNGLAVLVALGIPLLLRIALVGRNLAVRGLALAPIPAIAGVIYLASSRGAAVSAVVGTVAFVLLTGRRWSAVAAVAVAGASSVAAVLALYNRNALVNGPLGSSLAESQGKSAALIIVGVCVLTGLLYGVGGKLVVPGQQPKPALGWGLLAGAVLVAVAGIAFAHPVRRFEAFKKPPVALNTQSAIETHLLSSGGNGRWQLWTAAWKEFRSDPLHGRGAGSYEAWWARYGTIPGFVQDAHSLYLEVLGELGIVGFVLLIGAFASGLAGAVRRLVRAENDQRIILAAVTAGFAAYAVAAAVDWMWELTIVSVVAFVFLGFAIGPATELATRPRLVRPGEGLPLRARLGRYGLGAAVVGAGWLLICAIAIPLLSGARVQDSKDAVARGDLPGAASAARDARAIEPWSADPDLQLALIEEQAGDYGVARQWIRRAISHDSTDWSLWYVRSRLETKDGAVRAARRSIDRAKSLNPHSPLFSGALGTQ